MDYAVEGARYVPAASVPIEHAGSRWKTLHEVHSLLDRSGEIEEAVTRTLLLLNERHRLGPCFVSIVSDSGEIRTDYATGISGKSRSLARYREGEGITGRVVESGQPAIIPSVQDEPAYLNRTGSVLPGSEPRSFICVPVTSGGATIGTLGILLRADEEDDLDLICDFLRAIASLLGNALKTARINEWVNPPEVGQAIPSLIQKADLGSLVGTSNAILSAVEQALQVAATRTTVLIIGESGTGKELIAELIHRHSTRATGPLVKLNCAALPDSLVEAELFGHERGAFTGAHARRKGRFELADKGTIFLDEVGDVSLNMQTRLLRVLQEREFERVGGIETLQVDVRLIAATNKDLELGIAEGTFREDLYYRLNVFTIFVPPLRERKTDVLLLADHFVEKYAKAHSKSVKRISTPAIDMLMSYHWPGNVRELENCIERAVVVCNDGVIHSHHLPPTLQTAELSGTVSATSLVGAVVALEREMIIDALKTTKGNQARAAKLLQITERMINYKVKKYGVDCRRFLT